MVATLKSYSTPANDIVSASASGGLVTLVYMGHPKLTTLVKLWIYDRKQSKYKQQSMVFTVSTARSPAQAAVEYSDL